MAKTTYRTVWGADAIEITADFAQASCPVEGTNGRQVADFRHEPAEALRYAIESEARAEGLDPEDGEVAALIDNAVANMVEKTDAVRCPACGRMVPAAEIVDQYTHDTGGETICLACHAEIIESDSDLHCFGCEGTR